MGAAMKGRRRSVLAPHCFLPLLVLVPLSNLVIAQVDHVYGGVDVKIDEFVWFTAIQDTANAQQFKCSGALIGSRYVVTAKHCVENSISTSVEVGYWCRLRKNCDRQSDVIGIRALAEHTGDMVLLELDRSVSFPVQPAIPYLGKSIHPKQKRPKKGRKMTLVASGQSGTDQDITAYVRKLELRFLTRKRCQERISKKLQETDICSTVDDDSGGSACPGDSGGALVVEGKGKWKGRDVIVALHSAGPRDCSDPSEDLPMIHFRMSDAADLIQRVVCGSGHPEDWCEHEPQMAPILQTTPPPTPIPTKNPSAEVATLRATLVATLEGHADIVYSVSFNSNGWLLASGSRDHTVKIWNPLNGGPALSTFMGHSHALRTVQWNPSSTEIASGSIDREIKLWNVNPPEESLPMLPSRHNHTIHSVAWHPDARLLASGSWDNTIRIWNVETRENIHTIANLSSDVESVAYHPDGSQLAVGMGSNDDNSILIWSTSTNAYTLQQTLTGHQSGVWEVSYSPDGKFLASASSDGTVRIWVAKTGKLWRVLEGHSNAVRSVAWSPNGKYIVSGARDKDLRVWSVDKGGEALLILTHDPHLIGSVDWSSDGMHIASGLYDGTIAIWKIEEE